MLQGYKPKFEPKILNGSKGFTLRMKPKRMPKIGEILYMYTGLRTKKAKLITKQFTLLGIEDVSIGICPDVADRGINYTQVEILLNGKKLTSKQKDLFYVMDGFEDKADFVKYWTNNFKLNSVEADLKMFRWVDLPF